MHSMKTILEANFEKPSVCQVSLSFVWWLQKDNSRPAVGFVYLVCGFAFRILAKILLYTVSLGHGNMEWIPPPFFFFKKLTFKTLVT